MITIKEITKKMKELTYSRDFEVAHCEADDLLIEAIKAFAIKHDDIENIAELIDLYHSVGKYYA